MRDELGCIKCHPNLCTCPHFSYTDLLNAISMYYFGSKTQGTHPQQRDFVKGFMSLDEFKDHLDLVEYPSLDEYMKHIKLKLILRPAPKELL